MIPGAGISLPKNLSFKKGGEEEGRVSSAVKIYSKVRRDFGRRHEWRDSPVLRWGSAASPSPRSENPEYMLVEGRETAHPPISYSKAKKWHRFTQVIE